MKAYWIAHVTVTDPDQYRLYAEAAPEAFRKYNARFLARAGRHEQLEGAGRPRNVVVEFDRSRTRSPATTRPNIRRPRPSARAPARPIS